MAPAGVELSQFANVNAALPLPLGGANSFTGRDQRQDPDQYSREGRLCSPIGKQ